MGYEEPTEDNEEKKEEDLELEVEDNLEVTTKGMREEDKKIEDKKGDDSWRDQK
ncbi:MAG: hypothetical protein NUV61_02370 [Candidatus Azambacteria bacterium]|nr:hypothetical protein [Candidatus Azambacteria bacterium]